MDNDQAARWQIAVVAGIAAFGTLFPTAMGLKVNGVINLIADPTKKTYAVGPAGVTASSVVPLSMWTAISTDHGAMPVPRMTTAQRNAISPMGVTQKGLLVDDSDLNALLRWDGTLWLTVGRRLIFSTTAVNATTTSLGVADIYIATAAGITITISPFDISDGREFVFKDESGAANAGAGRITIATGGAETIDGEATALLTVPFDSINLYARGGNLFSK